MRTARPSSDSKHTKLPWHASRKSRYVSDINNRVIAEIAPLVGFEANAALIVRAVNSHAELVKALEEILSANDDFRKSMPDGWEGDLLQDACDRARRALSAARSEEDGRK